MKNIAIFDLLIRGGSVVDGTKTLRYDADIGIVGDRIAAIGQLGSAKARETIDATDKVVAPGFIDAHTHDDQALLAQPDMTAKLSQGVTTVITGNCGISAAPLTSGVELPMPLHILDFPPDRHATFGTYINALRSNPASVNVVPLVGHSSLRVSTMTELDRPAYPDEIWDMRERLIEALESGAFGLSTGLSYPTATHATIEEIVEVGQPLREFKGIYVSHMRNEADDVMASLQETFRIGRKLGVPVVVSHHKVGNRRNFGRSLETLPYIQSTMQTQPVCLDCYPYDSGSTMISTEPDMLEGRVLIVSSVPHPECAWQDLDEVAQRWGISKREAAIRMQPGTAIYFLLAESDVQRILQFPETMVGSDGLPGTSKSHPRLWGTFPRVLGRYCRDLGLFPLETAVWKMTGLTAKNFGIPDRGTISIGHFADIVVFDPKTIADRADYSNPTQCAAGIDCVIVNGQVAWANSAHKGKRSGQVLRREHV